jgi:hypothetical protein
MVRWHQYLIRKAGYRYRPKPGYSEFLASLLNISRKCEGQQHQLGHDPFIIHPFRRHCPPKQISGSLGGEHKSTTFWDVISCKIVHLPTCRRNMPSPYSRQTRNLVIWRWRQHAPPHRRYFLTDYTVSQNRRLTVLQGVPQVCNHRENITNTVCIQWCSTCLPLRMIYKRR